MAKWSTLFPSGPGNIDALSTGIIVKTIDGVTDTYANRTVTGTTNRIVVTNGNGVGGNPTLDIGTDVTTVNNTQTLLNKKVSSTNAPTGGLSLPNGTTGERPGTPDVGMVRWNSSLASVEVWNGTIWTAVGGSSSGASTSITQTTHGFVVGDLLYHSGSAYSKAKANASSSSSVVGMVSAVADPNAFTLTTSGLVTGLSGLTAGSDYFLSGATAGAMTATEPTTTGHVSAPVGIAASATTLQVSIKRSVVIGTSNVFTTIGLANTSPTTIQNISSFANGEGGVLTGVLRIDATTDYVFGFEISFTKDIAGVINHSVRYFAGDVLPGISVTVSGQNIQITLGTLAGFVSATARFQLSASAVSPSLQISARNVTGDTTGTAPGSGLLGEKQETSISTFRSYPATGTWEDAGGNGNGISLGAGVWSISMQVEANLNGASAPTASYNVGVSTTTGNSSGGLVYGTNRMDHAAPTSINDTTATIAQYIVTPTATTAYYGKVRAVFSSGNPTYVFRLTAIRIA
jgi:hypothetical protein